jgi:hypothetical protein
MHLTHAFRNSTGSFAILAAIRRASKRARRERLPAPWTVEESGESFHVRDAKGQILGYFYYEEEPSRRSNMNRLTRDEARRIVANVAKLPELLRKD